MGIPACGVKPRRGIAPACARPTGAELAFAVFYGPGLAVATAIVARVCAELDDEMVFKAGGGRTRRRVRHWAISLTGAAALAVALLAAPSARAAGLGPESLGPVPPPCGADYEYGNCLVQTRLGTFTLSPHVVHAGAVITGTISGECTIGWGNDGPCPIDWQMPAGKRVSGCGQFDYTCAIRIPKHESTAPYTTATVHITNAQGAGVSRDYYAIIGEARYQLSGHIKGLKGKPLGGVTVTVTGRKGSARTRTDGSGAYGMVLRRGAYVVSTNGQDVLPVQSGGCTVSKRTCQVNLSGDRIADFAQFQRLTISSEMPLRVVDDNHDGLIDYPTDFDPGKFEVLVKLAARGGAPCDAAGSYSFTVDGRVVPSTPKQDSLCTFVLKLKQGKQAVKVRGIASDGTRLLGMGVLQVRDFLIVGLGDSVASGEGNPDIFGGGAASWQDPRCDRSARSFEARAAIGIEQLAHGQASVTFMHLACSGAGISIGATGPYFGISPGGERLPLASQVSQLERLAGSRKVDAVAISIGANDIGFGDIVMFCALHSNCNSIPFRDGKTLDQITRAKIRALPGLYATLAHRLKAAGVPAARVYITQYFDPTRDASGQFCDPGLGLMDGNDNAWAYNAVVRRLNVQVATAAQQWGWHLVSGAQQGFRTHGYCSASSWIVSLGTSLVLQGDQNGTMHPNGAGHAYIAGLVLDHLRHDLLPNGRPRPLD